MDLCGISFMPSRTVFGHLASPLNSQQHPSTQNCWILSVSQDNGDRNQSSRLVYMKPEWWGVFQLFLRRQKWGFLPHFPWWVGRASLFTLSANLGSFLTMHRIWQDKNPWAPHKKSMCYIGFNFIFPSLEGNWSYCEPERGTVEWGLHEFSCQIQCIHFYTCSRFSSLFSGFLPKEISPCISTELSLHWGEKSLGIAFPKLCWHQQLLLIFFFPLTGNHVAFVKFVPSKKCVLKNVKTLEN